MFIWVFFLEGRLVDGRMDGRIEGVLLFFVGWVFFMFFCLVVKNIIRGFVGGIVLVGGFSVGFV